MRGFYAELERRGFPWLAREMNKAVAKSALAPLPAERILDFLMMGRAGRDAQDALPEHREFLNVLPPEARNDLIDLAWSLQALAGNHALRDTNVRKGRD